MPKAKISLSVNKNKLMQEIVNNKRSSINQLIVSAITPEIEKAQNELVEEFLQHPVTQEINAGPNSANISGLLNGYGNLFSFLGFNSSESPIQKILPLFKRKLKITSRKANDAGKFIIKIDNAPNKEEISQESPLSWIEGKSWIDAIEYGVGGFANYIFKSSGLNKSRSGVAVQSKKKKGKGAKFTNTSYLSAMFKKFKNKIGAR